MHRGRVPQLVNDSFKAARPEGRQSLDGLSNPPAQPPNSLACGHSLPSYLASVTSPAATMKAPSRSLSGIRGSRRRANRPPPGTKTALLNVKLVTGSPSQSARISRAVCQCAPRYAPEPPAGPFCKWSQLCRLSKPTAKCLRVTRSISCKARRDSSTKQRAVIETDRSKLRSANGRDSAVPRQYRSEPVLLARANSSHEAFGSRPTARKPVPPANRRVK